MARSKVMQANTKLKQFAAPSWEQNFKNSMSLYMGGFFLLITVHFTSSLNFSSEKKNVQDSSGAFIGQENGY